MAVEAFDVDGNPIEGLLSQEETQSILAEKQEIAEKLAKLEAKDMNFTKFRDMTEAERSKLSTQEQQLLKRQEELETEQVTFKSNMVAETKKDILDRIVGDDADLRAKVELNYNRLKDSEKASTRSEISALMSDALNLVGRPSRNPLSSAMNVSGEAPRSNSSGVSDELKEVGKSFGLSEEDFKKYS